jgi:multiple sugar transport system permease protein
MKKISVRRFSLFKLLSYSILFIGAFIMGFPFFWMISNSLMSNKQIYKFPPDWIPRPIMWSNYIEALKFVTPRVFLNSFIFTIGVTVGIIVLSLLSAYAFAKLRLPGKNILFIIYVASLMIPWQITVVPQFIIIAKLGWVNSYEGLIVPYFAQISVGTFFFRQFFLRVPADLFDAARIDGCSIPSIFFRIYIPLSKPAIAAFSTITALSAWNQYIWPLIATSSSDMQTLTVALGVLSTTKSVSLVDIGIILSASFLSIIPVLLIYIFAQRWFVEGIATTGLKY